MILQTGMRTDIPAFYSEWFANRLKAGYVYTRNPFNPKLVTKYLINPDVVDVIGFCSKNPSPMLQHMDLLRDYGQYWFVTITPYGRDIEPNVPHFDTVVDTFIELSKIVGPNAMGWRYDPILLNDTYTIDMHLRIFEHIAKRLAGSTHVCVISFVDLYEKVKRNFPEVKPLVQEERLFLGSRMIEIAKKYDMVVKPCHEGDELSAFGADCRGCMTQEMYEKATGQKYLIPPQQHLREECACVMGHDIGQYNTCPHLCRYCYANVSKDAVMENFKRHDPHSPLLVGHLESDDVLRDATQQSWRQVQLTLF